MRWLALFPLLAAGVCLARADEEATTCKGHSGAVLSLAFAPDGKTLAAGLGETIKLRDVPKLRQLLEGNQAEPLIPNRE